MNIQSDKNGEPVNIEMVNRKLESFVEVVLQKMIDIEKENKELKKRIKNLESK
jgi:hypothetical protein